MSVVMAHARENSAHRQWAVPQPGVALTTVVEERAGHVRRAVGELELRLHPEETAARFGETLGPRWLMGQLVADEDTLLSRAAWALVNMRLIGRLKGELRKRATLRDAECWFFGTSCDVPRLSSNLENPHDRAVCRLLEKVSYDKALGELLPYVLDPHGPGSRASVMRDPTTRLARAAKRWDGVFYTPADVAEYMCGEIAREHLADPTTLRCIDPACGSGVFLRAMLRISGEGHGELDRLSYCSTSLYGMDVNPSAVECACFLLLHDVMEDVVARGLAPWHAWHLLRLNFSAVDATQVLPASDRSEPSDRGREHIACALRTGNWVEGAPVRVAGESDTSWFGWEGYPLGTIFPEVAAGFDLLVGNPPYATIGARADEQFLATEYESLGNGSASRDNYYPLFIEMMWRLTAHGRSAAALVVPLSVSYHRGGQLARCRRAIMRQRGQWRFAFFDRQPHALFGEDVKTRNAIVLRSEQRGDSARGHASAIETGPLRKWTSRTRATLFSSIDFTPLEDADISLGIPKLRGPSQAYAQAVLAGQKARLAGLWVALGSCLPVRAFQAPQQATVFIASTAYNFLNVFRPHETRPQLVHPLSQNPIGMMRFSSEELGRIALAILSSRLVYWWWHVHADGFHVPRWFVETIPFDSSSFTASRSKRMADLGDELWRSFQTQQIVSVNGGRSSIAYRPFMSEAIRDEVDQILVEAVGIELDFVSELRAFVHHNVVLGRSDAKRPALLPI